MFHYTVVTDVACKQETNSHPGTWSHFGIFSYSFIGNSSGCSLNGIDLYFKNWHQNVSNRIKTKWTVERRHVKIGKTGLNNFSEHKDVLKGTELGDRKGKRSTWYTQPVANAPGKTWNKSEYTILQELDESSDIEQQQPFGDCKYTNTLH